MFRQEQRAAETRLLGVEGLFAIRAAVGREAQDRLGSDARAQSVWERAFDPRPTVDFDDRFVVTYLDPRSARSGYRSFLTYLPGS
jgi:hypothetical protein